MSSAENKHDLGQKARDMKKVVPIDSNDGKAARQDDGTVRRLTESGNGFDSEAPLSELYTSRGAVLYQHYSPSTFFFFSFFNDLIPVRIHAVLTHAARFRGEGSTRVTREHSL